MAKKIKKEYYKRHLVNIGERRRQIYRRKKLYDDIEDDQNDNIEFITKRGLTRKKIREHKISR